MGANGVSKYKFEDKQWLTEHLEKFYLMSTDQIQEVFKQWTQFFQLLHAFEHTVDAPKIIPTWINKTFT